MEYGNMPGKGAEPGNMAAHVENYQPKLDSYSQKQFGSTLRYIERRDKTQASEAGEIRKQDYKGRYD